MAAYVDGPPTNESTLSQTEDGIECVSVYNISGLEGNPESKYFQALNASGLPQIWSAHPGNGFLFVNRQNVTLIDGANGKVSVTYGPLKQDKQPPDDRGKLQIEVGSTLQEVKTNFDVDGEPIILEHTFTDIDDNGNEIERTETQTGEVSFQIPMTVLRLSRKETVDPRVKSQLFTGTVNSSSIFGDPARWWLCTKLEGTSDDGGKTFNVCYEFQRKVGGWDTEVVFIDPDTNRPPEDLVDGVGIKQVKVYVATEFRNMNIFV